MFLFQFLSAIKHNPAFLNEARVKSKLSAEEFDTLVQVAGRYRKEVDGYDSRAKVIIEEFRRMYPPGKLPPGVGPGQPPQELIALQQERDDAALRYRDEANGLINAEALESFVRTEIVPNSQRTARENKEGRQ